MHKRGIQTELGNLLARSCSLEKPDFPSVSYSPVATYATPRGVNNEYNTLQARKHHPHHQHQPKNKTIFSEQGTTSLVERDKLLSIIAKEEKDMADSRAIYRKISKNSFVQDHQKLFEEDIHMEGIMYLCQRVSLQTVQEKETVFKKGDMVDGKVYLIYKGEVEVVQQQKETKPNSQFGLKPQQSLKRGLSGTNLGIKPKLPRQLTVKDKILGDNPHSPKGKPAEESPERPLLIKDGEYFGQEAMEKKENREATVVAKKETYLVVINVSDLEYVKQRYEKEKTDKVNFMLKHLLVPHDKEAEMKEKLYAYSTERTLSFGETLFYEGDIDEYFYFLCEGRCDVQKRPRSIAGIALECGSAKLKKSSFKNVTVCVFESGTFVGEEVIFNKNPIYQYTLRVSAARNTFLKFKLADFNRVFDNDIVAGIEEKYIQKTVKHQEIFESITKEIHKRNSQNLTVVPSSMTQSSLPLYGDSKQEWECATLGTWNESESELAPVHKNSSSLLFPGEFQRRNEKRRSSFMPFHHQQVAKAEEDSPDEPIMKPRSRMNSETLLPKIFDSSDGNTPTTIKFQIAPHFERNNSEARRKLTLSSAEEIDDSFKTLTKSPKEEVFTKRIEKFRLFPNTKGEELKKLQSNNASKRISFNETMKRRKVPLAKITDADPEKARAQFKSFPHLYMHQFLQLQKKTSSGNKSSWSIDNMQYSIESETTRNRSIALPSLAVAGDAPKSKCDSEDSTNVTSKVDSLTGSLTPQPMRKSLVLQPVSLKTKRSHFRVASPKAVI